MTHETKVFTSKKNIDEFVGCLKKDSFFTLLNQYNENGIEIILLEKKMLRIYNSSVIITLILSTKQSNQLTIKVDLLSPVKKGVVLDFNATKTIMNKIESYV